MFQESFNMPDSSAANVEEKADTNKPKRTDLASALERKGIISTSVERNVKTATSVQRITQNTTRLVESHSRCTGETVTRNTRQTLVGRTVEKSVKTASRTVEKHSSSGTAHVPGTDGARPTVTSSTTSSSKVEKHVSSSVKVEKTDGSGPAVEESHRTRSTVKEKTKCGATDEKGDTVETMTQSVNRRDHLRQMMERRPTGGLKDSSEMLGKSLDVESRSEAKQLVVSKSTDGGKPDVSFTSTFKGEHGFREQVTSSPTRGRKAIEGGGGDGASVITQPGHKHGRKQNESEHGNETVTTRSGLFGLTSMLTGFVSGATNKAWCVVQNAYEIAYDYYSGTGHWSDWDSASDDEGSDEEAEEDTSKIKEKAQAKKLRLYNICNELMTTERDYVRKLEILVTAKNKTVRILQPDVAKAMFKDVEVIYQFHHDTLLPELQKRLTAWDKDDRIGDIMKKLAPFLKLSTEYVKQFEAALTLVETWQKKSSSFAALLREIAENPEYGRLHLNAFMIEPVQRIPRYGLLLRDYVNHLPKDSPDKPDAEKALELVEDAALHFEHMMKRDSVIGQLLKVQRQLDSRFGIVSPSRELIKEGKMMKVSIKNGKPTERYAFLFNDLLLVCSEHVLRVGKRYKVRDVVCISEIQMSESENKDVPNAFYIMTTEKVFELCTSNAEEKTDWQNAIWKQVGECTKNKLRTLRTVEAEVNRKSVGKRAPVLVRFCDVSMCMVCACEYTTIRRKHHCKGCGIVVCAKCSAHTAKLGYDKSKPLRICDGCFIVLFDQEDSKYSGGGAMAVGRQQSRTQGSAVHTGYLQFSGDGGRNWKKRWLVLNDNNSLYLFKAPQDLNPALTIHMDGTNTDKVELGPRKKRVVKLETERKVYLLHDQYEKVLEKWLEMIVSISVDESKSPISP